MLWKGWSNERFIESDTEADDYYEIIDDEGPERVAPRGDGRRLLLPNLQDSCLKLFTENLDHSGKLIVFNNYQENAKSVFLKNLLPSVDTNLTLTPFDAANSTFEIPQMCNFVSQLGKMTGVKDFSLRMLLSCLEELFPNKENMAQSFVDILIYTAFFDDFSQKLPGLELSIRLQEPRTGKAADDFKNFIASICNCGVDFMKAENMIFETIPEMLKAKKEKLMQPISITPLQNKVKNQENQL